MAIVQSINNVYQFREAFRMAGRMDQFSYEGLEVLFDYLENLSEAIEEPIELDVVALCCEYYESTIQEIIDNYNIDCTIDGEPMSAEEIKETVQEYLEYRTTMCGETEDGFVYAAF